MQFHLQQLFYDSIERLKQTVKFLEQRHRRQFYFRLRDCGRETATYCMPTR